MNKLFVGLVVITVYLSACAANKEDGADSRGALIKVTDPPPVELMENPETDSIGHAVKKEIAKLEELYDVAVIQGKEEILVSYKVKHSHRFHMKKIEKKMTKKLEKKYPDEKFIVSSDYKIFLETVRLKDKMKNKNISNKDAEKRFQEIIKLKEELT
ncbi:sporulation protein [Rossellomorea vietnamensis]|uniref:Sporulation protein n=1 Tax=Rossellomorea vietnamensis TaxID=218284 RepID=A0A5D4NR76_9BACI|nr:YhcN/YlaJ family sporulation lipoprotein [Rossellomorea vietnamensis]TYS15806.1 sporulation protein [Rossellomorea vietnamensis]